MKNYKEIREEFIPLEETKYSGYSIKSHDNNYSLINFSPGPAPISKNVLDKLENDLFTNTSYVYGNTPLEMSHRSPEFSEILNNVNRKIRNFMNIPYDFNIIWTQGGGHGQFSAIPLNMRSIQNFKKAGYLVNGTWSSRAYNESKKFINSLNILEDFYEEENVIEYNTQPLNIFIPHELDYVYLCSNETVNGVEYKEFLTRSQLKGAKLIVDMSSDFLMKQVNWDVVDVAFCCTSKNMGIPGANILIIRNDLLNQLNGNDIPSVLDWKLYSDTCSLYNTPAVFNIYLLEIIIDDYIMRMNSIQNIHDYSKEKSKLFYNFLDHNEFFDAVVSDESCRSIVNIPFIVGDGNEIIMSKFLHYCYLHNIVGLRTKTPFSYKSLDLVEPLRVSLYNGISIEDVKYLIKVMKMFTFCKDYQSDEENSCGSSICDESYIRNVLSKI
tara:strand:- start:1624 stop:2940 length:1317 start_codon:yes stop_codon:yes gene_type:complete